MIAEGRALLASAVARRRPGPFQIKAAIAALHAGEPPVDWAEVAALYGALWRHEPTPVVALNAAVAWAEAGHPAEGLALIESLAPALSGFQPYHAARADALARLGRRNEAVDAYGRAIALAGPEDARFLTARRARLMDLKKKAEQKLGPSPTGRLRRRQPRHRRLGGKNRCAVSDRQGHERCSCRMSAMQARHG
jgi:RNA polymerase sigma-70 factor (ECF subfamily)